MPYPGLAGYLDAAVCSCRVRGTGFSTNRPPACLLQQQTLLWFTITAANLEKNMIIALMGKLDIVLGGRAGAAGSV